MNDANDVVKTTLEARFAAAFSEWQRRYRDDPGGFTKEWAAMPAQDYGAQAAAYFLKLLREAPRG